MLKNVPFPVVCKRLLMLVARTFLTVFKVFFCSLRVLVVVFFICTFFLCLFFRNHSRIQSIRSLSVIRSIKSRFIHSIHWSTSFISPTTLRSSLLFFTLFCKLILLQHVSALACITVYVISQQKPTGSSNLLITRRCAIATFLSLVL